MRDSNYTAVLEILNFAHVSHMLCDAYCRGGFDVRKHGPELDIDGKYVKNADLLVSF